jgi:AcrR family transcriptional regulator
MAATKHHKPDTRNRLLQAGGEIFAQYGFRGATVRRIARRAHANVAAVNYYFAGKEGLYLAVLEHTFAVAKSKYPPDPGLGAEAGAPARLRAFVSSFLLRLLDEGRPAWHGRLMVREIADPSPVLDRVVDEMIRPLYEQLVGIVCELIGPGAGDDAVQLAAMSIMGQCLFYRNSQPVVSRLYQRQFDADRIREIAEHITAFSLQALQGAGAGY